MRVELDPTVLLGGRGPEASVLLLLLQFLLAIVVVSNGRLHIITKIALKLDLSVSHI